MKGECYEAAINSFYQAMDKKNRDRDQRMLRTYGMHVIDYFPHRELGIIHYYMGNFELSESELHLSISQEPSEKAKFYLDKVRTSIMHIQKQMVSKPIIEIDSHHKNEIWTNADPIYISGLASDTQYIKKITIGGEPIFMESAKQKVQFAHSLSLNPGKYSISITAENLLKGQTTKNLIVQVDRTGPVIMINPIQAGKDIVGSLYDASGDIILYADDHPMRHINQTISDFVIPFDHTKNKIVLVAKDRAGNQTQAVVYQKSMGSGFQDRVLLVSNEHKANCDDSQSASILKRIIQIDHWTNHNTVYSEQVIISGNIQKVKGLDVLKINHVPIIDQHALKDIHLRQHIYFSQSVQLKSGENSVCIQAEMRSGKVYSRHIQFNRKIENMLQLKHRFGMRLYPFTQKIVQDNTADIFYDKLIQGLIQNNRFRISLSKPLRKAINIAFNDYPGTLSDNDSIHPLLNGVMNDTGKGIEIAARVFDGHSEIIDFVDVYLEFDDSISITSKFDALANRLAKKFHVVFPLVSGLVKGVDQDELMIMPKKWYYGKGELRTGWQVFLFYKAQTEPLEAVDSVFIGASSISRLMKQGFRVNTIHSTINIGDQVITQ
jgi:hypothetical protein